MKTLVRIAMLLILLGVLQLVVQQIGQQSSGITNSVKKFL